MTGFEIGIIIALFMLTVALFLTLLRFLSGPELVDRVITFDLMSANLIGIVTLYAIFMDKVVLFDVNLVLALIAFMAILAFAFYIRNKRLQK